MPCLDLPGSNGAGPTPPVSLSWGRVAWVTGKPWAWRAHSGPCRLCFPPPCLTQAERPPGCHCRVGDAGRSGGTTKHQKKGRGECPVLVLRAPRGVQEPRHRQDSVCSMSEGALDTSDPRNSQGLAGLAGEGAKPLRVNFLCFWPITHLELCVFGAFLHASR